MRRVFVRSTRIWVTLVALLSLGVSMLAIKPVKAEEVRQAIEQVVGKWAEAFNRGDSAAVAALYTDDAILMPPDSAIIQGSRACKHFGRRPYTRV